MGRTGPQSQLEIMATNDPLNVLWFYDLQFFILREFYGRWIKQPSKGEFFSFSFFSFSMYILNMQLVEKNILLRYCKAQIFHSFGQWSRSYGKTITAEITFHSTLLISCSWSAICYKHYEKQFPYYKTIWSRLNLKKDNLLQHLLLNSKKYRQISKRGFKVC